MKEGKINTIEKKIIENLQRRGEKKTKGHDHINHISHENKKIHVLKEL